MIDRAARNHAALLVRRLASRRITSAEFDDALSDMDYDAKDKALDALSSVCWDSDMTRRKAALWVLFLSTEREYRWAPDLWDGSAFLITTFATMLLCLLIPDNQIFAKVLAIVRLWAWYARFERWIARCKRTTRERRAHPFFHASELQQARQFPRLLAGST